VPIAFITGASGQDGSYLTERLLGEGYEIHALHHDASGPAIADLSWAGQVQWHAGDISDVEAMVDLVARIGPDEIVNLAGISSVAQSWQEPVLTARVTGLGAVGLMEAAWRLQQESGRPVRMLQASSAEIFGSPSVAPQTELTPLAPTSPYGAAKAFAHSMAGTYRSRGLAVSACVFYNHESPRRPLAFVTRKITRTVAEISLGRAEGLTLGNLDARRDWGWAPDYVDALVRALRTEEPGDFVIATGQAHSVAEFVAAAFAAVGITDFTSLVHTDPAFIRPVDAFELRGDPAKAEAVLGWRPTVDFAELVARMVSADLEELRASN
jgi:GDPmannose 4,6-dehydratase